MPRIVLVSYNIRLDTERDGPLAWRFRKSGLIELLQRRAADVYAVQEALPHQLDDLVEGLGYAWVGLAREDGWRRGEFNPILYRSERIELVQTQTFWLSETPGLPGSRSWDSALPRIVTWARLRVNGGGEFVLLNTHFDYDGEAARRESARMLPGRIAAVAVDSPFILVGDFNTMEGSPAYRLLTRSDSNGGRRLLDARYRCRPSPEGPNASTNDWARLDPPESRIDFAFVSRHMKVHRHQLLSDRLASGSFPSDHLPLEVEVSWPMESKCDD